MVYLPGCATTESADTARGASSRRTSNGPTPSPMAPPHGSTWYLSLTAGYIAALTFTTSTSPCSARALSLSISSRRGVMPSVCGSSPWVSAPKIKVSFGHGENAQRNEPIFSLLSILLIMVGGYDL